MKVTSNVHGTWTGDNSVLVEQGWAEALAENESKCLK
jgi:hypothetical protein